VQGKAEDTRGEPPDLSLNRILDLRAEGVEPPSIEDFEGIYSRKNMRMYSLCLGKTGSEKKNLQDLAKEAFLQLLRMLDTFRGLSCSPTLAGRPRTEEVMLEKVRRRFKQGCI
jgi:hypothetical protein